MRSSGPAFDDYQHEALNANTPVNIARGIPKPRIRQHEFGFNLGGPVIRNRLFFFGNYEQIHVPGTTVLNRTVLTDEATRGIFRYVGADNVTRTANVLEIAAANGFASAIDPIMGRQLQLINQGLSGGTLTPQESASQQPVLRRADAAARQHLPHRTRGLSGEQEPVVFAAC